jgi:hypothetical protein
MAKVLRKSNSLPITVGILLLIGIIYGAVQLFYSLFAIPMAFEFADEGVLRSLLSSLLLHLPWSCMVVAGVIGLWCRKVWGWSLCLVIDGWLCSASIPKIDLIYFYDNEILIFVVFIVLFSRKVRWWCKVDFRSAIRWILIFAVFFLGWLWCSLIVSKSFLPPDLPDITILVVVCAVLCWMYLWISAYAIARRKMWGIKLGCLAALMTITLLVGSFIKKWYGLQQRVLWAFSTIYERAGLWIAVKDDMVLLGVILICVNAIVVFFLLCLRKMLLTKQIETQNTEESSTEKLLEDGEKDEDIEKRTSADVILALIALTVVVFHSLDLIAMGFGVGFIFDVSLAIAMLVPLAVILMLVRIAWRWKNLKTKQRIYRIALILSLILISLFFFFSPGFIMNFLLTDIGMRLKTASTGGAEQLQAWAIDILEKPQNEIVEDDSSGRIKEEMLSKQVQLFRSRPIYISSRAGDEEAHIRIIWGSGFHHWGILVGPPTFQTTSDDRQCVYRWRDGVYGDHEIQ